MDVLLNGALGNLHAKLDQFTPDPLSAPGVVIPRHTFDQGHDIVNQG
jgi:hypothetical protein